MPKTRSAINTQNTSRFMLGGVLLLSILSVAVMIGVRYALLLALGLGFGMALEGLRFGFAGPWRAFIERRDTRGLSAQLIAIGLTAVVSMPLINNAGGELIGAHAPVGWAMLGGAFVFGASMMIVLGCGSGTLVNAGSGNAVGICALVFFIIGSFAGSYHLDWWTSLGALPLITATGSLGLTGGVTATLAALAAVGVLANKYANPEHRAVPKRLWLAAGLISLLAILNLVVAGQPWGVVYGLGLWAAKIVQALGADLSHSAFWASPTNVERLSETILTDVTTLTNIGLITGAFVIAFWRQGLNQTAQNYKPHVWGAVIVSGFLLGYSSRLAFGCNVGAFFSGISTGSLHGWAWFVMAFLGAIWGLKLRNKLGFEHVKPRQRNTGHQ